MKGILFLLKSVMVKCGGHHLIIQMENIMVYEGEEQHCGQCKACFRKWVSLENNRIDTRGYWKIWDSSFRNI